MPLKQCQKHLPTYVDCDSSENFKDFQYFAEWCNNQIGWNDYKFQLDKDLLVKGNKLYSEDNCVFLPSYINNFIVVQKKGIQGLPAGIFFCDRHCGFRSVLANKGGELMTFNSAEEAWEFYKRTKENLAKELAQQYKFRIDPRAYEALNNYVVEITD